MGYNFVSNGVELIDANWYVENCPAALNADAGRGLSGSNAFRLYFTLFGSIEII